MTFSHPALPGAPALMLLACTLTACHTPSVVERDFGLAVRQAQSAQTQHPGMNATAVTTPGADAGTVRSGIVRYEKTFVTPPSPLTSLDQSLGTATSSTPR